MICLLVLWFAPQHALENLSLALTQVAADDPLNLTLFSFSKTSHCYSSVLELVILSLSASSGTTTPDNHI